MNPKEEQRLDDLSFGKTNSDVDVIDPEKQGISNRPGDEDPDSGVDREPGDDQTEDGDEDDETEGEDDETEDEDDETEEDAK